MVEVAYEVPKRLEPFVIRSDYQCDIWQTHYEIIVTLEDNGSAGGLGSAVSEFCSDNGIGFLNIVRAV
jgi:transketolase C-terminal domain/subunit